MNKQCKVCGEVKNIDQFNFHCIKTGRLKNKCKLCEKEYNKLNYQKQKQKYIDNANKWKQENKEKFLINQKQYNSTKRH